MKRNSQTNRQTDRQTYTLTAKLYPGPMVVRARNLYLNRYFVNFLLFTGLALFFVKNCLMALIPPWVFPSLSWIERHLSIFSLALHFIIIFSIEDIDNLRVCQFLGSGQLELVVYLASYQFAHVCGQVATSNGFSTKGRGFRSVNLQRPKAKGGRIYRLEYSIRLFSLIHLPNQKSNSLCENQMFDDDVNKNYVF